MKKIVLILICIFTFSLVGCNKKVNNALVVSHKKAKLNYPIHLSNKVLDNTSDITEDDIFIYYADKNGINKLNKKSGEDKLILKKKNVVNLVLSEGYVYFSVANKQDMDIFCIDKNGKKYLKVFDGKNMPEKDQKTYFGFIVNKNNIYINSGIAVYLFKMTSNELKLLCNDVEQFEINGDYMFYRDHAQRTQTIYRMNLKDMKTEIFLGKGIYKPKEDIYYGFIFSGDNLYFIKCFPNASYKEYYNGLYFYDNGKQIVISKNNSEWIYEELIKYNGNVYFFVSGSNEDRKLMKYDSKNNTISQVIQSSRLKDYYGCSNEKIVNGYLYYYTKDYKLRCIKLN